jgi:hypothetical protein
MEVLIYLPKVDGQVEDTWLILLLQDLSMLELNNNGSPEIPK